MKNTMSSLARITQRFIFIQNFETPNPNFIKFVPTGKQIMEQGTYEFTNIKQTISSPLALKLFCIEGIVRVFYTPEYISIGKRDDAIWEDLKPVVLELIQEHFSSDNHVFEIPPEETV